MKKIFLWFFCVSAGSALLYFGYQTTQKTLEPVTTQELPKKPLVTESPQTQPSPQTQKIAESVSPTTLPTTLPTTIATSPSPTAPLFLQKKSLKDLETPAMDTFENYLKSMKAYDHRAHIEEERFLKDRYYRLLTLVGNKDIFQEKEKKAFLLTPRELFVRPRNISRAYDHAFLDIGYGVTISGPFLVGRMTSTIDVQPGEKVLEIGTGSGYQSAVLSHLTENVFTVEIIEPLAAETNALYQDLTQKGFWEFVNIMRKSDDGYFGWPEYAPFDKIIVTCGIDHIPPELLKQLRVGGIMVIPVGPPGAQIVLKITKVQDPQGNITITREDIYGGRKIVPFVPFTKKGGGTWNQ